jgi:hypothetical protein
MPSVVPQRLPASGPLRVVTFGVSLLVLAVLAALAAPQRPPESAPAATRSAPVSPAAQKLDERFLHQVQPLMQKYCFGCHGNGKHKGDVTLDKFGGLTEIQGDRQTWEAVAEQLSSGSMPPEDKPQPSQPEIASLTGFVHDALSFRDCTGPRDPGKVTIRRLNRAEYNNTVRDLLGVDFKPAADFPADDSGYGFDNIADVLSMSPLLAEKYLYAAEQVLDRAIVTDPPKRQMYRFDGAAMTSTAGGFKSNDSAWTLTTSNGELWLKQDIAAGGEYEIRIRAYGSLAGNELPRLALRMDGENIKGFEIKATRDQPQVVTYSTPLRAGERRIAVAFVNEFTPQAPATSPAGANANANGNRGNGNRPPQRRLTIESITIDGPKNSAKLPIPPPTEWQRKLIFATPPRDGPEDACAKRVLQRFTTRAFRRPATDDEVNRLMKLFAASRADGDKYEKAIKTAMTAVLCSPHFLFRIEPPPASLSNTEKVYTISDFALASRLSYFLWSSMPDEDLFAAASAGKLHNPAVLEAQVRRMMADPKAAAFVENFAGQWLELRLLDDYDADPKRFPDFNKPLRTAMKQEAEQYFQSIVKEDHSVLELIDSNYTFLNERLAKFYGITDVAGEHFRRVPLKAASHRGGVLTMAGVLTVTAMPSRTSPVKRGKYILEQILGTPPPPPPPDVPALDANKKDAAESASLRQRLEAHRTDPTCASCHKRMDPLGFALENYDAIGKWRDTDGKFAIDASAVLPGGRKVDGADGLKKALLDRKDDFVRCLATKMLTYALGRGIEPYDRCTVEDICAAVKQNNYRFSAMLLGIVKSDAFQKRRVE